MNRLLLAAAVLLLSVGLTAPATARVVSGPDMRLVPPETDQVMAAKAGQIYRGRLEILGDPTLEISTFTIEGPRWSNLTWTPVQGAQLDPVQAMTVEFSGTPSAAGGGVWLMLVKGFAGMVLTDDGVSFRPSLPETWDAYTFKIRLQGCLLEVGLNQKKIRIHNMASSPTSLRVAAKGKEAQLHPGEAFLA